MSEHRVALGPATVTAAVVASAVHGLVLRPRMLTRGATREEAARPLPGDDLVPGADSRSTMATTLPAPPSQVWPWLAQMGCDRGGWYSWDRLDNGGRPSVDRLVPRWQGLEPGQRLASVPGGSAWFTVAVLVPERTLVLRADMRLPSGRPFDPSTSRRHRRSSAPSGASTSNRPARRPASSSARSAAAARACSPGRSTCCSGNPPTSSCRAVSSVTCARGSSEPRDHVLTPPDATAGHRS
ncbi:hypothetical protein L1856_11200 [Streptomyces sp. Tue 6430]|nr:hypothetical protein [Streptomyces sp. Tue 6430]